MLKIVEAILFPYMFYLVVKARINHSQHDKQNRKRLFKVIPSPYTPKIAQIKRSAGLLLRKLLRAIGKDACYFNKGAYGIDKWEDIKRLVKTDKPVIFDVGANMGQSLVQFKRILPKSEIHAFEPHEGTFNLLVKYCAKYDNVNLNMNAVWSVDRGVVMNEGSESVMNSFLTAGEDYIGEQRGNFTAQGICLDSYWENSEIDVLKLDVQGTELLVLAGADRLLDNNKIKLILIELTPAQIYSNQHDLWYMYEAIIEAGFSLVAFYPAVHKGCKAQYLDALFINKEYAKYEWHL